MKIILKIEKWTGSPHVNLEFRVIPKHFIDLFVSIWTLLARLGTIEEYVLVVRGITSVLSRITPGGV